MGIADFFKRLFVDRKTIRNRMISMSEVSTLISSITDETGKVDEKKTKELDNKLDVIVRFFNSMKAELVNKMKDSSDKTMSVPQIKTAVKNISFAISKVGEMKKILKKLKKEKFSEKEVPTAISNLQRVFQEISRTYAVNVRLLNAKSNPKAETNESKR